MKSMEKALLAVQPFSDGSFLNLRRSSRMKSSLFKMVLEVDATFIGANSGGDENCSRANAERSQSVYKML